MTPVGEGRVNAPCPACRHAGLQSMLFKLKSGDTAQMRRCGRCEWKAWLLDGEQVSLAQLLARVQEAGLPRAARQRPTST